MPALSKAQETVSQGQHSVVTSHVITWVLLTLAINSMAQPSGHFGFLSLPRKYRIYICLSPIVCLADALMILISMAITMLTLRTSIIISARYVWFSRLRLDVSTTATQRETFEPWNMSRCVVFVIGTLPALVKLVSFSGLEWSKMWGYMYVISFMVIEALNFMAMRGPDGSPQSEAAALRLSASRWNEDVNRSMRDNVDTLGGILALPTFSIVMLAWICQIILILWPIGDLLRSSIPYDFGEFIPVPIVNAYIQNASNVLSTAYLMVVSIIKLIKLRYALLPRLTWSRIAIHCLLINMISILCYLHPYVRQMEESKTRANRYFWLAVCILTAGIFCLVYGALQLLCLKVPSMGRMLLSTASMSSAEHNNLHEAEGLAPKSPVDEAGLCCLAVFCIQLCTGIIWYAYRYDPTGTSNPSWTDVFG